MSLRAPVFEICQRGFEKTMVLVPGWATDRRIFSNLDLPYNYVYPLVARPFRFKDDLARFISEHGLANISLFGWSSGGFMAADFCAENPSLAGELVLVSVRRSYPAETLEKIRMYLRKNRRAYLYKFYMECFSGGSAREASWFKDNLMEDYLGANDLGSLMEGLDYLGTASIVPANLAAFGKIRIFHGQMDKIAPFNEAAGIKEELPAADFVCLPRAGHVPFLSRDFTERFHG